MAKCRKPVWLVLPSGSTSKVLVNAESIENKNINAEDVKSVENVFGSLCDLADRQTKRLAGQYFRLALSIVGIAL